jgi:hypothetical protein
MLNRHSIAITTTATTRTDRTTLTAGTNLYLDAQPLHLPHQRQNALHTGGYPAILLALLAHPLLPPLLTSLKNDICDYIWHFHNNPNNRGNHINLIIHSPHARHRAVALGEIICFICALHFKGPHRHKLTIKHLALTHTPTTDDHCHGNNPSTPCEECTQNFPIQIATLAAFSWLCA